MEQAIEYIETMTQCLTDTGLRACNKAYGYVTIEEVESQETAINRLLV